RFGLSYADASGQRRPLAMLHRAILGSLERFLGILLEHHRGALPAWLAPEQVRVAPVSEAQRGYAQEVAARLKEAGLRADLDDRAETLSRRALDAREEGVPW